MIRRPQDPILSTVFQTTKFVANMDTQKTDLNTEIENKAGITWKNRFLKQNETLKCKKVGFTYEWVLGADKNASKPYFQSEVRATVAFLSAWSLLGNNLLLDF